MILIIFWESWCFSWGMCVERSHYENSTMNMNDQDIRSLEKTNWSFWKATSIIFIVFNRVILYSVLGYKITMDCNANISVLFFYYSYFYHHYFVLISIQNLDND